MHPSVTASDAPTAIVTGASRGLGMALTRGLADAGWRTIVDARDATALENAVGSRPGVHLVPGDVTDPDHRQALADTARRIGRLDAVVASAGGLGPSPRPTVDALAPEELTALLETNVVAPLGLVQAALPVLTPGGVIALVTSDVARAPTAGWGGYGASKAALDYLGAVLAAERSDLRVLQVDPGDLRTTMHAAAFPDEDISDRPSPESVVPAFMALLRGAAGSGRHELAVAEVTG